jgi:hypothetical protein
VESWLFARLVGVEASLGGTIRQSLRRAGRWRYICATPVRVLRATPVFSEPGRSSSMCIRISIVMRARSYLGVHKSSTLSSDMFLLYLIITCRISINPLLFLAVFVFIFSHDSVDHRWFSQPVTCKNVGGTVTYVSELRQQELSAHCSKMNDTLRHVSLI